MRRRRWNAEASSRTTHAAPEAVASCRLFAQMLINALSGMSKQEIPGEYPATAAARKAAPHCRRPLFAENASGDPGYRLLRTEPREAALWCFAKGCDFEETILLATNLGDDADTTAAIVGQLAGAYYGVNGIPQRWRDKLWQYEDIDNLARKLLVKSA